jgi:hypothetical protein
MPTLFPLAGLVPLPWVHLKRYHGVCAAPAALRAAITPAGQRAGSRKGATAPEQLAPEHVATSRVRRLNRVFGIEIERCARCDGRLQVIASIEEPGSLSGSRVPAGAVVGGRRRRPGLGRKRPRRRRCSRSVDRRRARVLWCGPRRRLRAVKPQAYIDTVDALILGCDTGV